jgi:hypothetical protein
MEKMAEETRKCFSSCCYTILNNTFCILLFEGQLMSMPTTRSKGIFVAKISENSSIHKYYLSVRATRHKRLSLCQRSTDL